MDEHYMGTLYYHSTFSINIKLFKNINFPNKSRIQPFNTPTAITLILITIISSMGN